MNNPIMAGKYVKYNKIEKELLKSELRMELSRATLDMVAIRKVKRSELNDWVKTQILRVKAGALNWAYNKGLMTEKEFNNLKDNSFCMKDGRFYDAVVAAGLVGASGVGSAAAFNAFMGTVTTARAAAGIAGWFSWTGIAGTTVTTTSSVVTTTTVAAAAAPVVLAWAVYLGYKAIMDGRMFNKFEELFNSEKKEIEDFYLDLIERA